MHDNRDVMTSQAYFMHTWHTTLHFPQTKAEMGHLLAGANEQKGACKFSVMGMSPHETLAPLVDAFINDFLDWNGNSFTRRDG